MCPRHHLRLLLACMAAAPLVACGPDNSDPVSHVGIAQSSLSLETSETELTLNAGAAHQVELSVSGRSLAQLAGVDINWQSSDSDIAWVDSDGIVHAVAPGIAEVTASAEGATTAITVIVTEAVLVGLALEPVSVEMLPCTRVDLETAGIFSNGAEHAVDSTIIAVSADESIVIWENSVDGTGGSLVSDRPGTTIVTVSAAGLTETVPVLVTDSLVSVSLQDLPIWLGVEDSIALQVEAEYSDGTSLTINSEGRWSIVDADPVAVLTTGDDGRTRLAPTAAGVVTVQWHCAGQTIEEQLQILDTTSPGELAVLLDGMPVSVENVPEIDVDAPVAVSVLMRTTDGVFSDVTADVSWQLSDSNLDAFDVAEVADDAEVQSLLLSAVPGSMYEQRANLEIVVGDRLLQLVLVSSRGVQRQLDSVSFLVEDTLGNVSELTPGSNRFLAAGDSLDLDLLLRYNLDTETLGGDALLWANSDPGIATIDSSGRLIAVAEGSSEIAAVHDGQIYRFAVTVVAP